MLDDEARTFLQAVTVPPRRDSPRLADQLRGIRCHLVDSPDGRVAAWRWGDGPAALLVHGFADDHVVWARLMTALVERERAFLVLDLPGHGMSEGTSGYDIDRALRSVVEALGPVDSVVAHSMACGGVCLAMEDGLTGIDRFVAISPTVWPGDRWRRRASRLGIPPEVADRARALWAQRRDPPRDGIVLGDALPRLETTLLFVHSVDDEREPFEETEAVAARCERARLLRVEGLDHGRTPRDPAVVRWVADHLAR